MSIFPGPFNRLILSFESSEHVICVILDYKISNWTAFGPSFGAGLQ
jgi:hypothetical protein